MSMLTHRHGDHARLKADYKRQAQLFVDAQPIGRDFYVADLSRASGMAVQTAGNYLRALESKGVVQGRDVKGDLRRVYKRVAARGRR